MPAVPDLLPEAIWTGLEPGKRACYDDDRIDHHSRLLVVQTPAIRQVISEGINVNVTLLFAQSFYEQVAEAYIAGLTTLARNGGDVSKVASVASFFISRIDSAIDNQVDEPQRLREPHRGGQRAGDEKHDAQALPQNVAVQPA